jgi:hypothetical protein
MRDRELARFSGTLPFRTTISDSSLVASFLRMRVSSIEGSYAGSSGLEIFHAFPITRLAFHRGFRNSSVDQGQ